MAVPYSFFDRTCRLLTEGKPLGTRNQSQLTCVILSVGIGVLSLSGVNVGVLSIGRVAAVLMILFSCRFGGVVGGSISGIVAGAMFGLATSGINGISGALAFAGLIAGLFAPMGLSDYSDCLCSCQRCGQLESWQL